MLDWNFPFWIAHRGAGKLAPENTLAAFRVGSQHGYHAFECDVKLSRDGELFLLHDATLLRTTSLRDQWGNAADVNAAAHGWPQLAGLDAGAWHSRAFAGEPMPRLESIVRHAQANGARLNLEIKPIPGMGAATGKAVAAYCAKAFEGRSDWPLLSSFTVESLADRCLA
jgi:glycerophosphoryl diester phosphodiesterase